MNFISRYLLLVLFAAVGLTTCAAPDGTPSAENASADSNANAAESLPSAPTAEALLALDKQANEAYLNGDSKFFESFPTDNFISYQGGVRLRKADAVKMISGVKCEVKDGWALTEPHMAKIDNDTYVISYKSNMEGRCTKEGKSEKILSPVRAATVWARNGEKWQAAFHGSNVIVDPTVPPADDKTELPKKENKAAADPSTAVAPSGPNSTVDPLTDALMAAESSIWEAWKNKDAKRIEGLTAGEITFVNIFGTYFADKAATVKDWTGPTCNVSGVTLTDGVGAAVSPTVGILTLTGTVKGSCGGQDISGQKIYANSAYVKQGDAWKWVFGFNSP